MIRHGAARRRDLLRALGAAAGGAVLPARAAPGAAFRRVALPEGLLGTQCTPSQAGGAARLPVLLVHGMNGGAWQFAHLQGFLAARGRPSLALDLRGHHGSRPVARLGDVAVADYVDDARLAAAWLGRCAVAGQSMGGLVAQKVAEAGDAAAAAFLCALPPAGIAWNSATPHIAHMRAASASLEGRPLTVAAGREVYEDLVFNRVPPGERPALHARLVDESGLASAQLFRGDVAVDASRVRCPTLMLAGAEDRLVPPGIGMAIAGRYGSTAIVLPAGGHYAVVAEPGWRLAAALVAAWLDEALGEGAAP